MENNVKLNLLLILLLSTIALVGCQSKQDRYNEDVNSYLKEKYPEIYCSAYVSGTRWYFGMILCDGEAYINDERYNFSLIYKEDRSCRDNLPYVVLEKELEPDIINTLKKNGISEAKVSVTPPGGYSFYQPTINKIITLDEYLTYPKDEDGRFYINIFVPEGTKESNYEQIMQKYNNMGYYCDVFMVDRDKYDRIDVDDNSTLANIYSNKIINYKN